MDTYKTAENILNKGGIGVLRTDTLYGIVGSAFSKKAVARIYTVRKRNAKKPLIILIHARADMKLFGIVLGTEDTKILRSLWPGKVSIIIACKRKKFAYLHRGKNTLAFRVPASSALRRLLGKTGPLVAPSANREGETPAQTIAQARSHFGSEVDFYIDRGRLASRPSTLVALEKGALTVKRKGAFKLSKRVLK